MCGHGFPLARLEWNQVWGSFMCDVTRSCVTWLIHVWRDSFMCDVTRSYVKRMVGVHVWAQLLAGSLLVYIFIYVYICINIYPPAPMNHVKRFKGWPPRDAPSKLVQMWYKSFLPDQRGLVEMKNPTRLSDKTSNAWSCAEDQILENQNLRNMISNICAGR